MDLKAILHPVDQFEPIYAFLVRKIRYLNSNGMN